MAGHELLAGGAAIGLVSAGAIALAAAWLRRGRVARGQFPTPPDALDPATPIRSVRAIAVAASIGAGTIHLALTPDHFGESAALGLGFVAAVAFQFSWIMTAVANLGRVSAVVGIAGNGVLIIAWLVSRTIGLPFGQEPWVPEAIGRPDLVAIGLEATVIVALVLLSSGWVRISASRQAVSAASIGFVPAVGIIAVATILALSGSGEAGSHEAGVTTSLATAIVQPATDRASPAR